MYINNNKLKIVFTNIYCAITQLNVIFDNHIIESGGKLIVVKVNKTENEGQHEKHKGKTYASTIQNRILYSLVTRGSDCRAKLHWKLMTPNDSQLLQ